MRRILLLALMMTFANSVLAGSECSDTNGESGKTHPATCVVVKNTELGCNKSSSSNYLRHCVATVFYDLSNDANDDVAAKVSCNVEINYLKSVMGIRDTSRQTNSQIHNLVANSSNSFNMPVEFKFSTQAEANNAELKSVNCKIDSPK